MTPNNSFAFIATLRTEVDITQNDTYTIKSEFWMGVGGGGGVWGAFSGGEHFDISWRDAARGLGMPQNEARTPNGGRFDPTFPSGGRFER